MNGAVSVTFTREVPFVLCLQHNNPFPRCLPREVGGGVAEVPRVFTAVL